MPNWGPCFEDLGPSWVPTFNFKLDSMAGFEINLKYSGPPGPALADSILDLKWLNSWHWARTRDSKPIRAWMVIKSIVRYSITNLTTIMEVRWLIRVVNFTTVAMTISLVG